MLVNNNIIEELLDDAGYSRAEKAKQYATDADLVIYVVDSSVDFDENDYEILELIQDKKCIVLLNKTDLESKVSEEDLRKKMKEDGVGCRSSGIGTCTNVCVNLLITDNRQLTTDL